MQCQRTADICWDLGEKEGGGAKERGSNLVAYEVELWVVLGVIGCFRGGPASAGLACAGGVVWIAGYGCLLLGGPYSI